MYLPTLLRSVPFPGPNSALKSPPMIGMYLLLCTVCFSNVRTFSQCGGPHIWSVKVHTHQLDVLTFHQDRGSDGMFVDVLNVDDSFPPLFVQHDSDFRVYDVSPIFQPVHVSTFHSIKLRPICSLRVRSPILRVFHLSALISCFLNNGSHFFVFWVVIFFLSWRWTHIFTSARHFVHDTMLRFAQSAASAFLFFTLLSLAAAVVVAVSLNFSQTQRNISINGAMLESSSSSFSSQVFHSFYFVIIVVSAVSRARWWIIVDFHALVPAFFLVSLQWNRLLTTRSPTLFSSSNPLLTTAHSRCDEFFVCHFCICLQLGLQHLGIWWTWEIDIEMFLPQCGLWLTRILTSSSTRSSWEECYVSYECNIWHTLFFYCGIFLQHPLISLSLLFFLSVLF